MRDLLAELAALLEQNRDCVWCSVVQTRGSTPQKAGAVMLVLPDGSQRGTLGGGCIEAEVKQRALRVLAQGGAQPQILTFCLDDNYGWDDGLICGGRMSILADPVRRGELRKPTETYYRCYRDLVEAGKGCTEAVIVDEKAGAAVGSRFLFDARGRLAAQSNGDPLPAVVERFLVPVQQRPRPAVHHGVAYLPILPRITLLIVGGGHVGQAVARLADDVDFDVWVLDDRQAYANRDRFPTAKRHLVGEIGPTLQQLAGGLDEATYCLIVTRGHAHDEEALYHLAEAPAGYVGMIGSKRKIKLIFEDLLARGIPPAALERVHAPLGLDIGSQTVMEIAVSIVAELIARRNLGTTRVEPRRRIQPGTTPRGEPVVPVGQEGRDLDNP